MTNFAWPTTYASTAVNVRSRNSKDFNTVQKTMNRYWSPSRIEEP